MDYYITADYHTHTVHSHGTGTIRDNVMAARAKGLREIAITDHGPGLLEYGLKRSELPYMRQMVDQLNAEFDDIQIYLGIEANLMNQGNCLDIAPEEFTAYDFVIAGYHYGMANAYCGKNFWNFNKGINNREQRIKNTDMALHAIYENDLKILTHPGDKCYFDMLELARACADRGTLMEINTSHRTLDVAQIRLCAQTDARFIISSDAHTPDEVGDFRNALQRALTAGLDLSRIVNIAEKPGKDEIK